MQKKRFNGILYSWYDCAKTKKEAVVIAERMRRKKYMARVVPVPASEQKLDGKLVCRYSVYVRKSR